VIEWFLQPIHSTIQEDEFPLEEGALSIRDLVFWRGIPFPIDWSFGIGVS
jgi:hypothetical protein